MSVRYKPGLAMEILHFDIKDHVTAYVLKIWWWRNTIP
jgi:hypothetical protein